MKLMIKVRLVISMFLDYLEQVTGGSYYGSNDNELNSTTTVSEELFKNKVYFIQRKIDSIHKGVANEENH